VKGGHAGVLALIVLAITGVAGAAVLSHEVEGRQAAVDRARAQVRTETRSLDGMRERHEAHENERLYDIGYESCGSYDLATLARRLGVAARPGAVASAFAGRYPVDFRPGFQAGCLAALRTESAA
jgi:hypothetical protein